MVIVAKYTIHGSYGDVLLNKYRDLSSPLPLHPSRCYMTLMGAQSAHTQIDRSILALLVT